MTCDPKLEPSGDALPDRSSGDPLDALLCQAVWSECDPERLARLNRTWDDLVRRRADKLRRRRRIIRVALATCACLASVWIGLWSCLGRTDALPKLSRTVTPSPAKTRRAATAVPRHPPEAADPVATAAADSRRLYAHALHVSLAHHLQRVSQQRRDWRAARRELQVAIGCLASCPDARAEWLIESGASSAAERERILWTLLPDCSGGERVAASKLLACVATARSLPTLRWLAEQAPTHAVATQCIGRHGSAREVYERTTREADPQLQCALAAALLRRGDPVSLTYFLRLAGAAPTSSCALQAAALVEPALDPILARLQSPRVSERLVAAKVLSVLPSADVSARLIELVANDGCRREVLITLARRKDPLAAQFLQRAASDEWLAATLRAAQHYVQTVP